MQVDKWGSSGWLFLHAITFNYPEQPTREDKAVHRDLFTAVSRTLPCRYCQHSLEVYLRYLHIDDYLDDRLGLTYWLYVVHNLVNAKLGKSLAKFEDVVIVYERMRARCGRVTAANHTQVLTCQAQANHATSPEEAGRIAAAAIQKYRARAQEQIRQMCVSTECRGTFDPNAAYA